MKFVPKPVDHSVNAPEPGGVRDLVKLSISLIVWIAGFYFVLGLAVDFAVRFISPELEQRLAQSVTSHFTSPENSMPPAQKALQSMLDDLARKGGFTQKFVLSIKKDPAPNAMALLGGDIVLTSGLLSKVTSENELAMVLGHELGHFQHRDHLRQLGRGLLMGIVVIALTGNDSDFGRYIQFSADQIHGRYSRSQEIEADEFGFSLVVQRYGHAGGTTDFFQRLAVKEKGWWRRFASSTHPLSIERTNRIQKKISDEGISVKPTQALNLEA